PGRHRTRLGAQRSLRHPRVCDRRHDSCRGPVARGRQLVLRDACQAARGPPRDAPLRSTRRAVRPDRRAERARTAQAARSGWGADDPARELRRSHVLDWFFISPYSFVRWLVLSVGEIVKELVQARRERAAGIEPRGDRAFPYPLARAAANVLLRHLTAALVIEEMFRAAPLIYVDFVDYDEIAHHSGVDRVEARDAIDGLDRILALIEKASLDAPCPYRFVV